MEDPITEKQLTREDKVKVLKTYLGPFFVKLSKEERAQFLQLCPSFQSMYFAAPEAKLKRFGAFYLTSWGRVRYRYLYSHALVDAYVGNMSDEEQSAGGSLFYDTEIPLLVIIHSANTFKNKAIIPLMLNVIRYREFENKPTLILTEVPLPEVKAVFSSPESSGGLLDDEDEL